MAVVVGQRQGRWATEIGGACDPAREAQGALQDAGLDVAPTGFDHVVGLAVVAGWRCVTSEAGHKQSLSLMRASLGYHSRRKVQRFLEHRVLVSAEICAEVPLPEKWQCMTARASCRWVLEQARLLGLQVKMGVACLSTLASFYQNGPARGSSRSAQVCSGQCSRLLQWAWFGALGSAMCRGGQPRPLVAAWTWHQCRAGRPSVCSGTLPACMFIWSPPLNKHGAARAPPFGPALAVV